MTTFQQMCCGACGIEFCVPQHFYEERKNVSGKSWYCPNGHSRVFAESDVDKYRREAERAKQQLARAEEETREAERKLEKIAAQKKRLEKRIAAGLCPCCNRTVTQLKRHIATKHPDYNVVHLDTKRKKSA